MTTSIVKLDQRQQTKFVCSACGSGRDCDCNAPALERLAEIKERKRQEARRYRDRLDNKNQAITKSAWAHAADDDIAACDADRPRRWRNSLLSLAQDTIAEWNSAFGDWTKFEATQELVDAADQAVADWTEIAAILRSNLNAERDQAPRGVKPGAADDDEPEPTPGERKKAFLSTVYYCADAAIKLCSYELKPDREIREAARRAANEWTLLADSLN